MRNQKHQETPTNTIVFEKARQLTEPYRRHEKRMSRCLLQNEVEFVNQALGHALGAGTLLDICCGTGDVSLMLKKTGFQTLGLDMNWLALAEFRQHSQYVPLVQGDALHLPFWNESINAIVALHCFDLLDRVGFLQECSRVMHYGGLLIFDALNRHSYKLTLKKLARIIAPLFASRQNDKWIDVLSFRELLQLINLSGCDLLLARGYGWPPFSVNSNSRLVNVSALFEQILRLHRVLPTSPRILMAVRKEAKR